MTTTPTPPRYTQRGGGVCPKHGRRSIMTKQGTCNYMHFYQNILTNAVTMEHCQEKLQPYLPPGAKTK